MTARRTGRLAAVVAAVGAIVLGAAAPAVADDSLTVSVVGIEASKVNLVATVPGASATDLPTVSVRFDDTALSSSVSVVDAAQAQAQAPPRAVVVVIDTSGSMAGAPIQAARDAATEFVGTVPTDVEIGVVAFADTATVLVNPTSDRTAVRAAISKLQANGNTALYDGLRRGGDLLANYPEKRLLLLTDGADTSSTSTFDQVSAALAAATTPVDVVTFQVVATDLALMRRLTAATGGTVYQTTSTAALGAAFRTVASSYQFRVVITANVPVSLAGRAGTLTVTATTPSGARTSTTLPVQLSALAPNSGKITVAPPAGFPVPPVVIVGLVFVALLMLALLLIAPLLRSERRRRLRQVATFGLEARAAKRAGARPGVAAAEPTPDGGITQVVLGLSDRMVQSRGAGAEGRVAGKLERAGMKLGPAEWTALRGCVTVVGAALAALALGPLFGVPIGGLAGWLLAGFYRSNRETRRSRAFTDQLPDALQMVIGSLRSGFSLQQALDAVTRDSPPGPVTQEFGRAVAETRIGADLADAIERVAERTGNADLGWAVMAIRIQRETGGNLAEVLETTVQTIRERDRLRRHVRALSAEGRLSAYILVGLPIVVGAWMFVARREYMSPLWTTGIGLVMLISAVVLVVVGALWMARWVKVEV